LVSIPLSSEELQLALNHVERLIDRRQANTSFYLTLNTGVLAVIGVLLQDSQSRQDWLPVLVLPLLCAGLIACWIWRSLLYQYEILLDWWYARLRELEASMTDSAKLVTREYQDLYVTTEESKAVRRIGMTRRELALNWVFIGLYAAFAMSIVWSWLF